MSHIDNVIIQVRARLQQLGIKLWEEPYYYSDIGSVESEIDRLAQDFSTSLSISISNCKLALTELQDGALRKLATRKEFNETGLATFSVRRINNQEGTQNMLEVKCPLNGLGTELQKRIAEKLQVSDPNRVKCISSGKIIDPEKALDLQGIKNNQQLMVIISDVDRTESNSKEAMYDRIRKIKMDVEAIVDSERQLFEMEDQDGNLVFLPPNENRALLMAMGFCEKARAAMKRQHYDEALILLLEADEKFSTCNSQFLESVDNYALINLDIVWCYLCLKNVTQLPDAQRRLEICERSFRRSYGENMNRLIALKGNACPERALLMRLHLLQGVVFFHQNRRNEAYERLEVAAAELRELKVDDASVMTLVEMGYEPFEARLGLRACSGNLEQAITFIHERREKKSAARLRSQKERKLNAKLSSTSNDKDWVNPRSVCTLMEMGFQHDLVVAALKQSKNDLQQALDLLQTNADALLQNLPTKKDANSDLLEQLKQLGFNENMVRVALETTENNPEKALDFLVKIFGSEEELRKQISHIAKAAKEILADDTPSTSSGNNSLASTALDKMKNEMESYEAYERFNQDLTSNEQDYLDLPLQQEEQILAEYKRFLEQ
ncbi:NEDD8 ultimate buster 1-like [Rhagoletis pomonella]|uniref:NEDD8 ultimate buster 1-like n=1 Tax=Rhagoletis pomonella TaxID=28610 RepID=UPI0017862DBF|nr:NEDD8 ultimate buster 1-like [Rhagoletis pomonella]